MPFGDQIQEPGGLGRLPRVRCGGRPELPGPAAGGDRALVEHPGAEPGQGGGGGQGQAEQPQQQATDDGQRGGCLIGGVLVAGQGPGADGAAAVQGQGDAQAGEDQGGGVGDGGFQGRDGGEVAGGVDHAVLGREADRGGSRGQDAQADGGV